MVLQVWNLTYRLNQMEDGFWWKTTIKWAQSSMEDALLWKTPFYGRWPSMEVKYKDFCILWTLTKNYLWMENTFNGGRFWYNNSNLLVEDTTYPWFVNRVERFWLISPPQIVWNSLCSISLNRMLLTLSIFELKSSSLHILCFQQFQEPLLNT